jgi:hypothetical protein
MLTRNLLLGLTLLILAFPATTRQARADSILVLHEGNNVCSIESRKRARTNYKIVGTFPTLKEACDYAQGYFDGSQDNKMVCWEYTDTTRHVANSQDLALKLERGKKWITGGLALFFVVGLFVHKPFISITGLLAVYFVLGCLAFAAYAYIIAVNTGTLSPRLIVAGVAFGLFTIFWVGVAIAYHEAFGSNALYIVATKDAVYDNVRLARSSSNGFLIARDKRIKYIPSGEVKSISQIE